jgi:hypothetical protein
MLRRAIAVSGGFAFLFWLAVACTAGAAVFNGPFSQNGLAPTLLPFTIGNNDVFSTDGRMVTGGDVNPDYFTFTVPAGLSLTGIAVLPGTTSVGPLNDSFIGLQAGKQVTVPTTATTATGLLGWFHFGPEDIGTDILPEMGVAGLGSTGFTPPLGSGDYAVWVQETGVCGPSLCRYGLEFALAAIPEPASSAGLLTGLALLAAFRRSRQQARRRLGNQA